MFFLKNLYINFFTFFDKLLHLINNTFRNFFALIVSSFIFLIYCFYESYNIFSEILNYVVKSLFFYDNDDKYKFSSNMVSEADLSVGFYRLLSVDNNVVLPYNCFIRFLITSVDVLHS